MADIALTIGSFLLGFGPILSLFFMIIYKKAQLVILVTTSAFFYLLAVSASSLFWYLLDPIIGLSSSGFFLWFSAILPSVIFQFVARCAFVRMYHKVEFVIQQSLERQRQQQQEQQARRGNAAARESTDTVVHGHSPRNENNNNTATDLHTWTDAAHLKLALNDGSSAIASATGFGGMQAMLLYGTLLASETKNNVGILYQESCPHIPTLVVAGIMANLMSILQVFYMLLTFFGMRRRLAFHRGAATASGASASDSNRWNSRTGGNSALLLILASHLIASSTTMTNGWNCVVALPLLFGTVLVTAYLFWAGCGRNYMPQSSITTTTENSNNHVIDNSEHRD